MVQFFGHHYGYAELVFANFTLMAYHTMYSRINKYWNVLKKILKEVPDNVVPKYCSKMWQNEMLDQRLVKTLKTIKFLTKVLSKHSTPNKLLRIPSKMLAVKKWPAVCHHCEICKNYLCGLVKITYQSKIPSKIGKIRFFSKFVFRTIKPLFIHPFEKSYFNDMSFGTSSILVIPITWYVLKKRVLNSKYLDTDG